MANKQKNNKSGQGYNLDLDSWPLSQFTVGCFVKAKRRPGMPDNIAPWACIVESIDDEPSLFGPKFEIEPMDMDAVCVVLKIWPSGCLTLLQAEKMLHIQYNFLQVLSLEDLAQRPNIP